MKRPVSLLVAAASLVVFAACVSVPDRYYYSSEQQNPPPPQPAYAQQPQPTYAPPPPQNNSPPPQYGNNGYQDPNGYQNGYQDPNAYPEVADDTELSPDEVSVDYDAPVGEPPPIEVAYAPPPMLYDPPPPAPDPSWTWVGGYWIWGDGAWAWARGRWMAPPRYGYRWFPPYYDHRANGVVFVGGHWGGPGYEFHPPAPNARIAFRQARPGYHGASPVGPLGTFVPPPPGSRRGIVVSAPIGTAPQVVTGAPPVIRPGMAVRHDFGAAGAAHVSIYAPRGVSRSGAPVNAQAPINAHSAAALRPVVNRTPPPPAPQQQGGFQNRPGNNEVRPQQGSQPSGGPGNSAPPPQENRPTGGRESFQNENGNRGGARPSEPVTNRPVENRPVENRPVEAQRPAPVQEPRPTPVLRQPEPQRTQLSQPRPAPQQTSAHSMVGAPPRPVAHPAPPRSAPRPPAPHERK